jgi:hypothetical protein
VIVKGFEKCCILTEMGENDGDMLWNDSEEDVNVKSDCEEDERTACEDGDSDTDW